MECSTRILIGHEANDQEIHRLTLIVDYSKLRAKYMQKVIRILYSFQYLQNMKIRGPNQGRVGGDIVRY